MTNLPLITVQLPDVVRLWLANVVRSIVALVALIVTVGFIAAMVDPNVVGFHIFRGIVNLMQWKEILFSGGN